MSKFMSVMKVALLVAVVATAAGVIAAGSGGFVVAPASGVKWMPGPAPQVSTASVDGDMNKGASHFMLKYGAGFVTPLHHHTADHYVTLVSGNLVMTVDGKDNRLTPGSYFALTGKKPHVAKCEGPDDCVMSIDARGAWDLVMEDTKPMKK